MIDLRAQYGASLRLGQCPDLCSPLKERRPMCWGWPSSEPWHDCPICGQRLERRSARNWRSEIVRWTARPTRKRVAPRSHQSARPKPRVTVEGTDHERVVAALTAQDDGSWALHKRTGLSAERVKAIVLDLARAGQIIPGARRRWKLLERYDPSASPPERALAALVEGPLTLYQLANRMRLREYHCPPGAGESRRSLELLESLGWVERRGRLWVLVRQVIPPSDARRHRAEIYAAVQHGAGLGQG